MSEITTTQRGAVLEIAIDRPARKNALTHAMYEALAGRPAELHQITCPVLALAFADDHIVPLPSAQPLVALAGARDKQLVTMRGGHVGAVVSRKAAAGVWAALHQFWSQRD